MGRCNQEAPAGFRLIIRAVVTGSSRLPRGGLPLALTTLVRAQRVALSSPRRARPVAVGSPCRRAAPRAVRRTPTQLRQHRHLSGAAHPPGLPTSPRRTPRSMRSDMTDWSCIVARVMSLVRRTIAAWLDAPLRYRDIAQQAAQQPALCTAEGMGLTGRTRPGPLTRRSTSRRAVGAPRAAGPGPSAAERGRAGRRAARL